MKIDIKALVASIIGVLTPLIPFIGTTSLSATERAVTIPEADIKKMCKGMSDEDTKEAIALGHKMSDSIADFAVFVASRGKIEPDEE